jgi:radical SAM protein with 4Fe4S-binding SPASM domain
MIDFHNDDTNENDRKSFIQSFTSRGLDRLIIKRPHNWAGNIALDAGKNHSFSPCTFPWHALVVLWDGRVGACPHDFFAKIIYGNVKEESLKALFNSSEVQKLRRQMLQRDVNVLESSCKFCDSITRKKIMGIPLASFKYLRD